MERHFIDINRALNAIKEADKSEPTRLVKGASSLDLLSEAETAPEHENRTLLRPDSSGLIQLRGENGIFRGLNTWIHDHLYSGFDSDGGSDGSDTSDDEEFGPDRYGSVTIGVERAGDHFRASPNQANKIDNWQKLSGNVHVDKLSISLYLGKAAKRNLMTPEENYGIVLKNRKPRIVQYQIIQKQEDDVVGEEHTIFDELKADVDVHIAREIDTDWPPLPHPDVPDAPSDVPPNSKASGKRSKTMMQKMIPKKLNKKYPVFLKNYRKREENSGAPSYKHSYVVYSDIPYVLPPPPKPKPAPLDGSVEQRQRQEFEILEMHTEDLRSSLVRLGENSTKFQNDIHSSEYRIKAAEIEISKISAIEKK